MSETYFTFYKRLIDNKGKTKEQVTADVTKAHNKGKLTDEEYNLLLQEIEQVYNNTNN